jgi:hypothetical protein
MITKHIAFCTSASREQEATRFRRLGMGKLLFYAGEVPAMTAV